ncbi:MAG TPA: copper resistance protein NlpE [Luteimonas sp.]|jgi:copper homeostasis protein (lipoprotein)|nr:copper resistance protein NlpE [Luteimonas sp.]
MERNTLRTHATAFAFALLACACSRGPATPDTAQAPAPAAPAAAAPVAATESAAATTMAQPGVQPADAGADARAFSGTYSGTLPCADCPGIDETLVLSGDGTFVQTDTYRERPGAANVVQGNWSLESDGRRVRLDPGSKDAADRLYEVDGRGLRLLDDEGKPIDGKSIDGKPIDSRLPYRLDRDA